MTALSINAYEDSSDDLALEGDQYLTFALGGEEYGIEVLKVQEIIGYRVLTSLPDAPPWVKGVLNLRGAVVPVVDARVKFKMPREDYNKYTVIVIVVVQGRTIGLIVDAVSDVVAFAAAELQAPPRVGSRIRQDFIRAMGRKGEKFVILLDIDRLLSLEELDAVEQSVN